FALASAYAGTPIGPGPLDLSEAFPASSLATAVHAAVLEGCIGETVAAVEAREAVAAATDPAVRAALSRVALEEQTHAARAFRFVKWALAQADPTLRGVLLQQIIALVDMESRATAPPAIPVAMRPADRAVSMRLAEHGVLASDARAEIRRRVVAEVV